MIVIIIEKKIKKIEKTLCSSNGFHWQFEMHFNMKKNSTLIPTNLVTNLLLSLFCPFVAINNKNKIFIKFVV